jgi:serine/threonine protein kinase
MWTHSEDVCAVLCGVQKIYTILEYCGRGEFFAYVQNEKFTAEVAQHYFRQLIQGMYVGLLTHKPTQSLHPLSLLLMVVGDVVCVVLSAGVHYLHSRGVCHRDLSLENLLMDDKQSTPLPPFSPAPAPAPAPASYLCPSCAAPVPCSTTTCAVLKICDFGVALACAPGSITPAPDGERRPGKLRYMAPEVFAAQPYDARLSDVWSCGVILFVMLVGGRSFFGSLVLCCALLCCAVLWTGEAGMSD